MRTTTRGAAALAGLGLGLLTFAACAPAARAQGRAERGMLGVRLWNSYSTVLAKHGPPTSVETGLVMPGTTGAAAQTAAAGMPGGMAPGGMMSGMMPGMPPRGPMMGQGMPPSAGMGAMRMGGSGMGPVSGGAGMGKLGMMGEMGMSGGPMGAGMPMGMGGPGGMAVGQSGATSSAGEEVSATWVYDRGSVTDTFAFNKDGRVIQIASYNPLAASGHVGGGGVTAQGIQLGDLAARVYKKYGWAKIDATGGAPLLDYTRKDHVAFYLADSKRGPVVVGIAITLLDNLPGAVQPAGPATLANSGMGPMGPMGSMGMMGRPGMSGPAMGMFGGRGMGIGPRSGPAMGSGGPMAGGMRAMGVPGKMGGGGVGAAK